MSTSVREMSRDADCGDRSAVLADSGKAHRNFIDLRELHSRSDDRIGSHLRCTRGHLPSPRQMQTLVQVWKQLWKWR